MIRFLPKYFQDAAQIDTVSCPFSQPNVAGDVITACIDSKQEVLNISDSNANSWMKVTSYREWRILWVRFKIWKWRFRVPYGICRRWVSGWYALVGQSGKNVVTVTTAERGVVDLGIAEFTSVEDTSA